MGKVTVKKKYFRWVQNNETSAVVQVSTVSWASVV